MNAMTDILNDLVHMGGYAAWVWPAYGLAAAGIIGILFFTRRTLKQREREFEALKTARREGVPS